MELVLNIFYVCRCNSVSVSRAVQSSSPVFLAMENCTASFRWDTRAACAISTTKNSVSSQCTSRFFLTFFNSCTTLICHDVLASQNCAVVDPISGFEFNLQLLASKTGYNTTANGKQFLVKQTH